MRDCNFPVVPIFLIDPAEDGFDQIGAIPPEPQVHSKFFQGLGHRRLTELSVDRMVADVEEHHIGVIKLEEDPNF